MHVRRYEKLQRSQIALPDLAQLDLPRVRHTGAVTQQSCMLQLLVFSSHRTIIVLEPNSRRCQCSWPCIRELLLVERRDSLQNGGGGRPMRFQVAALNVTTNHKCLPADGGLKAAQQSHVLAAQPRHASAHACMVMPPA